MSPARIPKRDVDALIAFIDSRQTVPHALGRRANDCVGFALGAVEAQTGIAVAPKLDWSTPAGARRALKRFGPSSPDPANPTAAGLLEAAFDAHFERVPPAQAMRGDIAGVPDPDFGIHPMIVEGVTLVGPGDGGNRRMARGAMIVAWSSVAIRRSAPAQPGQPAAADRKDGAKAPRAKPAEGGRRKKP